MKSFKRFIQEEIDLPNRKFVKVPTNLLGQNNDITDSIFDIIDKTYKNIGGYPDFKKPSDLPDNHTDWYAADVDKDPDPDITTFGKMKAGNYKLTGAASDGTPPAKAFLVNKIGKLMNTSGNYVEASDALAHVLMTKKNVPYVTACNTRETEIDNCADTAALVTLYGATYDKDGNFEKYNMTQYPTELNG